jgi:hypothetical protein
MQLSGIKTALAALIAARRSRFTFGSNRTSSSAAPAQAFTTFVSGYLYDALVADGDAALGYLAMTGVSVVGLVLALMLWVTRAKPNTQLAPA